MGSGGAERVAATLANAWVDKGYEVILMPTFSGRGVCFYQLDPLVRLVFLADLIKRPSPFKLVAYLQRSWKLRQFVRGEAPDVLVSFLTNVNVMVTLATRGLGIKTLVSERIDPFHMPISCVWKILRALAYPLASGLVVQTEAVASKYKTLWRPLPAITVIGNPVPESLSVPPVWHSADQPIKRLLAIGRLDDNQKGFDILIRVFSRLQEQHPDWVLRIVGEGSLRGVLEELVTQLGLDGRVELPGRTDGIKNEFLGAEAFVLASRYEGFPNALLEAMAVGVPSVAVDCPSGPKEISENGRAAMLVPPDDEQALYGALDTLMRDRELRLHFSDVGRKSVLERFALDKVLAQWQQAWIEK